MKIYKILFLLLAALSLAACDDDDDDTDVSNTDDPRIRLVKLVGISNEFVINDVENLIFNYDSISKGTDVSGVYVYFYGYTSTPSIAYKTSVMSEWKNFSNGDKIDFSDGVFIMSTSQDGSARKEYKFDLRIHDYDVEAFSWEKYTTIDLSDKVVSQKSLSMDGDFYWFCRTEGGQCYRFLSSDKGQSWSKKEVSVENALWETLSVFNDSLWIQLSDGSLVTSDKESLSFSKRKTACSIDRLLFEVNGDLWAISGSSVYAMKPDSADFSCVNTLPSDFSVEDATTFTAASGFTQLGYIYSVKDGQGTIWSLDYKGNLCLLLPADGTIPALTNPMVYIYNKTLGIVGGTLSDGTLSTLCYTSYSSGKTWTEDSHKDLSNNIGGIEYAGVFVYSDDGQLIIVGGNDANGASSIVWKGVLNQITADNLNYND